MLTTNNKGLNGHAGGNETAVLCLPSDALSAAINEVVGTLDRAMPPLTHTARIVGGFTSSAPAETLPAFLLDAADRYVLLHPAREGWKVMAYVDSGNFAEAYAANHPQILVIDRRTRRILGPATISIG